MNAMETNLLIRADRMSESTLVGLRDWELAHLRVAMLHQLEETLEASLADPDTGHEDRSGVCGDGGRELEDSAMSEDYR